MGSASRTSGPVLWDVDPRGVATVTLNRPEVNNAYNGELVEGLLAALDALGGATGLRAVIVKGNGKHFQAGADLKWLDSIRTSSPQENIRVSRATAEAVARLNHAPVPTIALIQGGCFGGGTGLAAACDVVIAADNAVFSIAEVRWGVIASIIVPQLNDAIGGAMASPASASTRRRRGGSTSPMRSCRSRNSRRRASASSVMCWRTALRRSRRPRPGR